MDAFKRQAPYPYPKNILKNKQYAKIIKQHYSGCASELTAVLQYIYHHINLKKEFEDVSKCLEKIAIVEMHHFDMLGQLVLDLGGEPVYTKKSGIMETYWDSSNVFYGRSPLEMIQMDLKSEKDTIRNYEKSIELIDDDSIRIFIKAIIEDEQLHLEWFEKAYASLEEIKN